MATSTALSSSYFAQHMFLTTSISILIHTLFLRVKKKKKPHSNIDLLHTHFTTTEEKELQ
jgi:hypothetical protein